MNLIKVLMQFGIMAPITQSIDHDTTVIVGEELGVEVRRPKVIEAADSPEAEAATTEPPPQPPPDTRSSNSWPTRTRIAWSLAPRW